MLRKLTLVSDRVPESIFARIFEIGEDFDRSVDSQAVDSLGEAFQNLYITARLWIEDLRNDEYDKTNLCELLELSRDGIIDLRSTLRQYG